jgi:tetratricopeptide (TPR) repeat protein
VLALPTPALADRQQALKAYERGKQRYDGGEFLAAIELFEQAYQLDPLPAYIFNIAQAYRLAGDCGRALAHYAWFLETSPAEQVAASVDELVRELREECDPAEVAARSSELAEAAAAATEPPAATEPVAGPAIERTAAPPGDDRVDPTPGPGPDRLILVAEGGAAFFDIGDAVLPVSATLRLGAAYPLSVGPLRVEPGAAVVLSTMPYQQQDGDSTAMLTTFLVNAAVSYPLGESLRVGGEVGVGLLRFSGLAAGNPFSEGAMETGGMQSVAIRIGAGAEYRLLERLGLSAGGAFGYAGAHERLRDAISSVTRIELLTGVRYRW